jgi:predicted unusual protein kinase regulating ubiquinone biosynthesis (AarF/ABC1/UbiB family)
MIPTSRLKRAGRLLGSALGPMTAVTTLGRLKGGAHKLGQTLALVADSMPPDVRERLGGLFGAAEPRPWDEVKGALDGLPGGLLAEVEPLPFAAASMGQVHRGRLDDGRAVAIKILYPGVAAALRADLDNLETVALPARLISGGTQMLAGLRGALLNELDLRVEAAHGATMAEALRPWPRLHVATPIHATQDVLVAELLLGPTLHNVLRPVGRGPVDPQVLAEDLVAAVFGPVFRAGKVNADAHPGNLIVTETGLGIIDLGAVAAVPDVQTLEAALDRALTGRRDGVLEGLGVRAGTLERDLQVMLGPLGPGPWDFGDDTLLEQLGELKRHKPLALRQLPFTTERLPLIRAVMGLHYALRRLGVPFALGESLRRVRDRAARPG